MTAAPPLPAQIEAVRRAIETRDHQSEQFEGARYDAEALHAVLATLQQHERLEAAAREFLRWWDFHGMDRNFEYIGLKVGLLRAALDSAAPETPPDMSPINPSEGGE